MSTDRPSVQMQASVVLRPYASPMPLGLLSFAVGLVLIAGIGLDWITGPDVATAGLVMTVFVAPLEFLAAVMAIVCRDVGVATVLGLFATSWIATGLVHLFSAPTATSHASGVFLLAFAVVLVGPAVAAVATRPLLAVMLGISVARAAIRGIHEFVGTPGWAHAEGVVALVVAALAIYNGFAFLFEDARQKPLLPTGRRGVAAQAMSGDTTALAARTTREAGVREHL